MAEQRRNQRPSGDGPRRGSGRPTASHGRQAPTGGKPAGGKPATGGKPAGGSAASRDKSAKSNERSRKWTPEEGRAAGRGSSRSTGRPPGGGKGPDRRSSDRTVSPRGGPGATRARNVDQAVYDGPDLPVEVTGAELDHSVAAHFKGLPEKLANRVARHLVVAGMLVDSDPELAYQHALAARAPRRASRSCARRRASRRTPRATTPRRSPSCAPRSG